MSITATIEDGKIVLPAGVNWPNGTVLRIEPVEKRAGSIWELMKEFDGIADDLPPDMAANHDHYIHGHPKK